VDRASPSAPLCRPASASETGGPVTGLGFAVGGSVLDRKTLRTLAITLMGGLTTLITMLTALGDAHDGFHGEKADAACELSNMEKDIIRRLLANGTCAFNDFEAFNRSFASYLR